MVEYHVGRRVSRQPNLYVQRVQTGTWQHRHSRNDSPENRTANVTPSPEDRRNIVHHPGVHHTGGQAGSRAWGPRSARQRGEKLARGCCQVTFPGNLIRAEKFTPTRYKHRDAFGESLLSYLDEWTNKQAAAGNFCAGEKDCPY